MLHELLEDQSAEILRRTRVLKAERAMRRRATDAAAAPGIYRFLDDLVALLRSGSSADTTHTNEDHPHEACRQREGSTIAHAVREYRDVCRVVTQLAVDVDTRDETRELGTLDDWLDDAVAQAIANIVESEARRCQQEEVQRLGALAHELRNHLQTASLSYHALERGGAAGGAIMAGLGRSLAGLKLLVDRALARVRLSAEVPERAPIDMRTFLQEIEGAVRLLAADSDVDFVAECAIRNVVVEGDRQSLWSAVFNILQNALKFTRPRGRVCLGATASPERVLIVVSDQCGGWQSSRTAPHVPHRGGAGLGLGLAISRRAVGSIGGLIRVNDDPGVGCVVTIDLPRTPKPAEADSPAL